MKNMKKLISMLLLACMLTAMLSASAFAAGTPSISAPESVKSNDSVNITVYCDNPGAACDVYLYVNGVKYNTAPQVSNPATDTTLFVVPATTLVSTGEGTASVYAEVWYDLEHIYSTNTANISVSPYYPTSIDLNTYEISLNGVGDTGSVTASILPADDAALGIQAPQLIGGDASCASVSFQPGSTSVTFTAAAAGTATYRIASVADASVYKDVTVKVSIPVIGINLSPSSLTIDKGASQIVTASLNPSNAADSGKNAPTVTWSVSRSGVVDFGGITTGNEVNITGVAAGEVEVYASAGGKTQVLYVTVRETAANEPKISIVEGNDVTMTQGDTKRFSANVSNAYFYRWLIEQNGSYATLSNTNNIYTDLTALSTTNLGPIKLIAQARTNDNQIVEATCNITINTADILTLKANPQNITTGYTSTVSAANPLTGERFNWQYQLSAANVAVVQQHNNGEYVTVQAGTADGYVTLTATSKTNANRTAQIVVYVNTTAPHGSATIYPTSATWTRGNGNLSFNVNPGVYWAYLDNTLLNNLGTSYATYYNGVLTLKSAYLSTLSSGNHTLKVYTSSNTNTSGQPDGLVYAQIYINGSASNYGDSVHVKGSGYNLYFTASDPVRNVYISNTWIDPSNYSLDATGKQLTLNANFLNQLAYGNYTMRLDTANGSSQTATFRIVAANYAPATGDDNNIFVWITVLAISGAGVIALVPRKKKQM